jgi:predicted nucleic acid-binding protein
VASSQKRLFFDASVLFAGCYSPAGASGLLLEASAAGTYQPIVSQLVVSEASRALRFKADADALLRLHGFLAHAHLTILGIPSAGEIEPFIPLIASKDCHVLASAVAGRADYLLTLDRRHFFTSALREAELSCSILTPGEFLELLRS